MSQPIFETHLAQPKMAAEHIPSPMLRLFRHKSGLPRATGFVEESFQRGDPTRLDNAHDILDNFKSTDEIERFQVRVMQSHFPAFVARAAGRRPHASDLRSVVLTERSLLLEIKDRMLSEKLRMRYTSGTTAQYLAFETYGRWKGLAGELETDVLGTENELRGDGDSIFFSSTREENPADTGLPSHYHPDAHDRHTYNPAEPGNRVRISVKNTKNHGDKFSSALVFNIEHVARSAVEAASYDLGIKMPVPDPFQIIDIVASVPGSSLASFPGSSQVKRNMAGTLQDMIDDAKKKQAPDNIFWQIQRR